MADALAWIEGGAKALSVLVAWALVVLGWAVANELAALRDRRKVELEKVERLRHSLAELEAVIVAHHTEGFKDERFRQLTRRIKQLGQECAHFERLGIVSGGWRAAVLMLRRTSTMFNDSKGSYVAESAFSPRMSEIYHSIDSLSQFLVQAHELKFFQSDSVWETLRKIVSASRPVF